MKAFKCITALLLAATLTLSLCTVVTPIEPDTGYEDGIDPCSDNSDFGDVDYF